jgi:hypothetical protein
MSYLSIRHMQFTMARREQGDSGEPIPTPDEAVKYWWIERRNKRSKIEIWLFVKAFWATEIKANQYFQSVYPENQQRAYRLREILIGKQP